MIFFSGTGGLSGDIWLATMLAALGSDEPLRDLERNIPWIRATLKINDLGQEKEARIYIKGAEDSPRQTWEEMKRFVLATDFDWEVKYKALSALKERQYHEARGLGFALEKMLYSGKDTGDTLFDVLGGIYFWHLLGSPPVGLSGYLDIGYFPPPATRRLLADIPNKTPRQERELTTPTAAALLKATYRSDIKEPGRDPDLTVISGGKYADEGRIEKTLSRHYFSD